MTFPTSSPCRQRRPPRSRFGAAAVDPASGPRHLLRIGGAPHGLTPRRPAHLDWGDGRSRRGGVLQLRGTGVWGALRDVDEDGPRAVPRSCCDSWELMAYSKQSDIVTEIVREAVPVCEKSSIDEFYADLSGMDPVLWVLAILPRTSGARHPRVGLPISVGSAPARPWRKWRRAKRSPTTPDT